MTREQFLEDIKAACKRPKMYTPTGSFFEAVSLLEGIGAGAGIDEDKHTHLKFTRFRRWMAGRVDGSDRFPFSWVRFAEQFETEQEAFVALPSLYQEFIDDTRVN